MIAARAGVSRGAQTHHFATKTDMLVGAFEHLLLYGNDVGLFAEEIDPATGTALGNFPQAFTHVGLINAALTLAACGAESGDHDTR